MTTSATTHCRLQATSKGEHISSLEDRYIKLLESKIAHLESQLAEQAQEQDPAQEVRYILIVSTFSTWLEKNLEVLKYPGMNLTSINR